MADNLLIAVKKDKIVLINNLDNIINLNKPIHNILYS